MIGVEELVKPVDEKIQRTWRAAAHWLDSPYIKLNPVFFHSIYTELIYEKVDVMRIRQAVTDMEKYIEDRPDGLFKAILDYLKDKGSFCSVTEIDEHIGRKIQRPY